MHSSAVSGLNQTRKSVSCLFELFPPPHTPPFCHIQFKGRTDFNAADCEGDRAKTCYQSQHLHYIMHKGTEHIPAFIPLTPPHLSWVCVFEGLYTVLASLDSILRRSTFLLYLLLKLLAWDRTLNGKYRKC